MRTFDYDDGLLAAAGLHRAQLPELAPPGAVIGTIPADLADELACRTGCRWWPASATASPPGSAPASSSPARPT